MAAAGSINCKLVKVSIELRDKTTTVLSENVSEGGSDGSQLKSLSDALLTMQEKLNTFLTGVVEQERAQTQNSNNVNNSNEQDDEEEDDDEDSEDEPAEPPAKQPKTS